MRGGFDGLAGSFDSLIKFIDILYGLCRSIIDNVDLLPVMLASQLTIPYYI